MAPPANSPRCSIPIPATPLPISTGARRSKNSAASTTPATTIAAVSTRRAIPTLAPNCRLPSIYWEIRGSLRRFTVPVALAAVAACAFAQQQQPPAGAPGGNQLDANEALFTVMVALNAAGYNADADSPTNSPLRREIRDFFVTQRLDSLNEIRGFMRDHHQANPYAEYSQYVSLALTLGDPPNFSSRYDASALPPDVQRLDGFTPLLAAFYREAHVNQLWRRAQPVFDNWIARLQPDVARAVLQVNAYLR